MQIRRLSRGTIEANIGKMWLRLSPVSNTNHYQLSIRRRKDNGYTSSRVIFELDNPHDLDELADAIHQLYAIVAQQQEQEQLT